MLEEPREELQKSLSLHRQGQDTSSVEPPTSRQRCLRASACPQQGRHGEGRAQGGEKGFGPQPWCPKGHVHPSEGWVTWQKGHHGGCWQPGARDTQTHSILVGANWHPTSGGGFGVVGAITAPPASFTPPASPQGEGSRSPLCHGEPPSSRAPSPGWGLPNSSTLRLRSQDVCD